jgi:hypothetical protein
MTKKIILGCLHVRPGVRVPLVEYNCSIASWEVFQLGGACDANNPDVSESLPLGGACYMYKRFAIVIWSFQLACDNLIVI